MSDHKDDSSDEWTLDTFYPTDELMEDASDLPVERCALCRFYMIGMTAKGNEKRLGDGFFDYPYPASHGRCRRFPPTIDTGDVTMIGPKVDGLYWCGEFQPVPLPEEPRCEEPLSFDCLNNLSPRAMNCILDAWRIRTGEVLSVSDVKLGHLMQLSKYELMHTPKCGAETVLEIMHALKNSVGFELKDR